MKAHEKRIVDEQQELSKKLEALTTFIGSKKFEDLEPRDRSLLRAQSRHMRQYCRVLGQRIKRFKS